MYNVLLKSKDNHEFSFRITTEINTIDSREEAIEKALDRIKELGWEHHQYKFERIEKENINV